MAVEDDGVTIYYWRKTSEGKEKDAKFVLESEQKNGEQVRGLV